VGADPRVPDCFAGPGEVQVRAHLPRPLVYVSRSRDGIDLRPDASSRSPHTLGVWSATEYLRGRSGRGKEDDMMPYGWHDGGWGIVWMILSWAVIVALVWAALRAFARDGDRREPPRDPKDVLAERFAKGEIGADEYRERLSVLEETRTPMTSR